MVNIKVAITFVSYFLELNFACNCNFRDTLPSRGDEMGQRDKNEEESEKATQGTRMTDMIDKNTESAKHMA